MKLRQESEIDVQDIGEMGEIKSTIADENLGLALTMMSKNLYSDPIGSFIREITSNAVDANVDANIDEPVIVHLFEEDDVYYIEFTDNGTGMSPETFQGIYMSWFNSDKRDTNDKIGGWGLGSKSPLAYQNFFEVITRFDGTKYHYVMSNESTEPKADLLTEEETNERNGTTIRIEVKSEDVYQVSRDCERQLAYFKTVYVKNELSYYDNNFKIYEKGLWKLRNINQPFATMHICLGQVAYPINWEVLEIEPIRIPVALSFEVGELDVTVSREEINYTERVRSVVIERINTVLGEISDLYTRQLEVDDFFDFFKLVSQREKPNLVIEDVSLKMTGVKAKLRFRDFEELAVKKDQTDKIFSAYTISKISSGKLSKDYRPYHLKLNEVENGYLVREKMNFHDTRYINDGLLFRKRKINRKVFKAYAEILGQVAYEKETNYTSKTIYKPGAAKVINKFLSILHNAMDERLKIYDGICPEWDKEAYNEEQREIKERRKEHITFYNANNNRDRTNIQTLLDKYRYVFYVNRDMTFKHKNTVQALYDTLDDNFRRSTKLIFLAQTSIKRLRKYDSMMDFNRIFFLPETSNHFYKYNISKMINENLKPYARVFRYSTHYGNMYNELLAKFDMEMMATVRVEKEDQDSYYSNVEKKEVNLFEYFQEYISKATTNKNYEEYRANYRQLLFVGQELEILKYLVSDTPSHVVAGLIKGKGITKLDEQFYKIDIS